MSVLGQERMPELGMKEVVVNRLMILSPEDRRIFLDELEVMLQDPSMAGERKLDEADAQEHAFEWVTDFAQFASGLDVSRRMPYFHFANEDLKLDFYNKHLYAHYLHGLALTGGRFLVDEIAWDTENATTERKRFFELGDAHLDVIVQRYGPDYKDEKLRGQLYGIQFVPERDELAPAPARLGSVLGLEVV